MPVYSGKDAKIDRLLGNKKRKRARDVKRTPLAERLKRVAVTFFRLFMVLLVICLIAFIGRAFYYFLYESNYFCVKEVVIEGVTNDVRKEISAVIGEKIIHNENIFNIGAKHMKTDIESKMPKLADVDVRKIYPSTVFIFARVRKPVVYVGAKDLYLMDKQGVIIETINRADKGLPDLPFITGIKMTAVELGKPVDDPMIVSALEVLIILKKANPEIYKNISEINVDAQKGIFIVLVNGSELRFSKQNLRRQLASLDAFIRRIHDISTVQYADFRFQEQIVYKPRMEGAVAQ